MQHVFKVRLISEDEVHEIVNEIRRLNGDENLHEEEDMVNDGVDGNEIELEDENKIEDGNESEEEPEDVD